MTRSMTGFARCEQRHAAGVLTWELATGEHPFGTDPASILARMTELIEGRTTGLTRALPLPGLDRIARRCMRGNPAERYPTAEAVLTGSGGSRGYQLTRCATAGFSPGWSINPRAALARRIGSVLV